MGCLSPKWPETSSTLQGTLQININLVVDLFEATLNSKFGATVEEQDTTLNNDRQHPQCESFSSTLSDVPGFMLIGCVLVL
eukprot:1486233-Amphidinium_carterae.2